MKAKITFLIVLMSMMALNLSAQKEEAVRAIGYGNLEKRGLAAIDVEARDRITIGDERRVSLNLSKFFQGETINSTADFVVTEGQTSISLNLSGSCKEGEITLTIVQPDGNIMQSQKITNAADVSWSARFPIEEGDEKKFIGKWKLEVKTSNAEGRYSLHISSR